MGFLGVHRITFLLCLWPFHSRRLVPVPNHPGAVLHLGDLVGALLQPADQPFQLRHVQVDEVCVVLGLSLL